jgi:hypothetical protein
MAKATVLTSDVTGEIVPKDKEAQLRVIQGESMTTFDISTDDLAAFKLDLSKGRTTKRAGRKGAETPAPAAAEPAATK